MNKKNEYKWIGAKFLCKSQRWLKKEKKSNGNTNPNTIQKHRDSHK